MTTAPSAAATQTRRRPSRVGATLKPTPNPTWLLDPPQGRLPAPPVVTRAQLLPFGELPWQDFERLCLRLARTEGKPDHWQLFGEAGEEQGGIDVFVRDPTSNRYVVWQAKRHRTFNAAKLKNAIKLFLNGEWAARTDRFVLATAAALRSTPLVRAVEEAARDLAARGITFVPMDSEHLSDRLKNHPEIVDDFFDRPWVERFCGLEVAAALGSRLGRRDYAELRARLAEVYGSHFASVDPGVIRAIGIAAAPPTPLPLGVRFVPPDLYASPDPKEFRADGEQPRPPERELARIGKATGQTPAVAGAGETDPVPRRRQALETWSGSFERAVIIGAPGAGKSTLLRFLALDLFAAEPRLRPLRDRWPGYLPIWISFAFWTRQIVSATAGATASLEGAISHWLQLQDESALIPLVGRALADGRVILLVDGVDEWLDETAAGTALTLLTNLVGRRHCPVVVTSRPYGERVLRHLDSAWERRELAPLTVRQQAEFVTTWFETDSEAAPARARAMAQAFVAEIRRSPELAELAGVPLLLGGLIALRLSGANLPRSRFKAYAELSARLMDVQPAARDRAALSSYHGDELDRDTRERALCALAFHIQENTAPDDGVDAIPNEAAAIFCKGFLEGALALPPHEARRRASQLIELGEQSLGVLVRKSPREVGFLHRAFQEFLAGKHLSTQELDVQLEIIRVHATEPRWRDVLFFGISFLARPTEVDRVVAVLEASKTGDPVLDQSLMLLLADVAFGSISRRPETIHRLAADLFAEVETGSDATLRREMLQRVVGGLGVEATSGLVRARLRQWFPSWHDYNLADCLRLITDWSEPEVDEVLWRNLCHARPEPRRQAALSLAHRHGTDPVWRDRLLKMASRPQSADACAAAITALAAGWPGDGTVRRVIEAARRSEEPTIMLAGVQAAIALGSQSEADLRRLLKWVEDDHTSRPGFNETVAMGWSGSPTLKSFLLKSPLRPGLADNNLTWVAIKAFPQDDDVADSLVAGGVFDNKLFSLHHLGDVLAEGFRGHPRVAAAIEAKADEVRDNGFALAKAARIAPTPLLKQLLLDTFQEETHLKFWQARALLSEWGMADHDVAHAMESSLTWSLHAQAEIAHHMPAVIPDRAQCRNRLVAILRLCVDDRKVRPDFVLEGLAALGAEDDREALGLALKLDVFSEHFLATNTSAQLLRAFPKAPEVVSLALENLRNRKGLISVVALCQGDNRKVREAVLDVAAPLSEDLRYRMVEWLGDRAAEDNAAMALLIEGGQEIADSVMGASLVAETRARQARGHIDEDFRKRLSGELFSIGPYMDTRCLSAICALLVAGLEDMLGAALGPEADNLNRHQFMWLRQRDTSLWPVIAEHWGALERAVSQDRINRELGLQDGTFFEVFGPHLDQSPEIQAYAIRAFERLATGGSIGPEALRYAVRTFPNAPRTLDLCLSTLRGSGAWIHFAPAMTAAELLGREFADSTYAFERIAADAAAGLWEGPLAALCEGWPDSAELEKVFGQLKASQPHLPTAVALKVISTKSDATVVAERLSEAVNTLTGDLWDGFAFWTPNVIRRIQRDEKLAGLMMARLHGTPTANEKVSFAALLAAAGGYTGELADWCAAELERAAAHPVPEAGLDVTSGTHRLVPQRLRELSSLGAA